MCHTECQLLTTFFLHFIYLEKIKNDEKIYWKLFAIFKRSHRYFMIFLASQYHATSVKFFNFPKFRHWKSTKKNNTPDEKRDHNTRKTTTKSPQTCAKWIECYFIQISNGSVKRRRDLRTMIYCQKEFMFVLQQSIEKFGIRIRLWENSHTKLILIHFCLAKHLPNKMYKREKLVAKVSQTAPRLFSLRDWIVFVFCPQNFKWIKSKWKKKEKIKRETKKAPSKLKLQNGILHVNNM